MKRRLMTHDEFLVWIAEKVKRAGNQRTLARDLSVSDVYISDVLSGRRMPGGKLLKALGYKRVIYYEAE